MGSVVGCTKRLCTDKTITEINLDIKQNMENLNTIISNKILQTKPALNGNAKDNISNNDDSHHNNEEEENGVIIIEEERQKEEDEYDEEQIEKDIYKKDISKIILIQDTFKRNNQTIKRNINANRASIAGAVKKTWTKLINIEEKKSMKKTISEKKMLGRSNTINFSSYQENELKKNIHKYSCSNLNNNKNGNNGINGIKDDIEEIISVEQPFMVLPNKMSTKIVNNYKALEFLKTSSIINNQNKGNKNHNLFRFSLNHLNYSSILSDFGDRGKNSIIYQSGYQIRDNRSNKNLKFYSENKENKDKKENKDIKIRRNHDNIKGNFMLKNEKVIRYQGGFIKKTRKKNGFGVITWSDNSTLHGTYISNSINGIARFYNSKYKSTFTGEYLNNAPKGFGVYHIKNLSLQGYWDKTNLSGIVIEVWDDGTYYQGEFENNKKNGIGLYRWPDGTIYQGEFNDGQMTGKGIIFNSDDSVFSGEMLNGCMNGYGIFSWGNGALYMGYYFKDIKHGFGIYIWDSKMFICYIGFWEMGKQQGIGAKINGNKIKYCIWNKGKIATTLKGLYEIDRYLTGYQKGYYHFFTAGYIAKLKANNYYICNPKI